MAIKWHTVCTKLTKEELEIIDQACIKYKTNRNEMIRVFLQIGLKFEEYSQAITDPNSALAKTMSPIVKTVFNKKAIKQLEKGIEKKESKIPRQIKQNAINSIQATNSKYKIFEKHNPVGAPKQRPGKRGRPVDKGYER
jgi:hypothetical protein